MTLATLLATPPTAYRLLKDFVELKKGDVIVQNGANSAVGKYVIQLAHFWGFKTINVVRNRPNIVHLKAELRGFGADEVYTEDEFKKLPENMHARLALDCVGGESSLLLSSTLVPGGVLVNYGSMSGQPVQVSPRDLIFKNIHVRGFLLKNFYEKASVEDRTETFAELVKMFKEGAIKTPTYSEHLLDNVAEAVKASRASTNSKQILCMSQGRL
ncbi:Protein MECR-1 [Aphelenchoides avenae]|nr:Protein MECR-1 [Aphelenchus avenae]